VRHIAAAILDSEVHKARVELARTLQAWQTANTALAAAKDAEASADKALASARADWELETRPIAGWLGRSERKPSATTIERKAAASKDRDAATVRRKAAEADLASKVARIEELRRQVAAAALLAPHSTH
jgi:hypothetical protein